MGWKNNNPGCNCGCSGGTLTCACPSAPATINITCSGGSSKDYCHDLTMTFVGTSIAPLWYGEDSDVRSASCDGLVSGGNAYGFHRLICVGSNQMQLSFLCRSGPCPTGHSCSYSGSLTLCTWTMTTSPNTCTPFTMASGVNGAFSPAGTVWAGSG